MITISWCGCLLIVRDSTVALNSDPVPQTTTFGLGSPPPLFLHMGLRNPLVVLTGDSVPIPSTYTLTDAFSSV